MTGINHTTRNVPDTGNPIIDGLLSALAWNDGTILYSFPTAVTEYNYGTNNYTATFAAISAAQETVAHFALNADIGPASSAGFSVEGFTDVIIDSTAAAGAHLRFAQTSDPGTNTAFAYYPFVSDTGGDIWFGTAFDYRVPEVGNYAYLTLIHEVGHALGLEHGHTGTVLPSEVDSMEFSVMTYRSYENGPTTGYTNEQYGYAQTWMMADIAALQYMYGADFTTNSTNTVYSWDPASGDTLVNGAIGIDAVGNRIFATIWDGGGTDTYDLSAYTTDLSVDLRPGEYSLFSAVQQANLGGGNMARGNIFNALQFEGNAASLIENAIGGTGDDLIVGNAANNVLTGGAGTNTVSFDGAQNAVTASLVTGMATGDGTDTFTGFVNMYGGVMGDNLTGDSNANIIMGLTGADMIFGGGGSDTIYGGNDQGGGPALVLGMGSGQITRGASAGNDSVANALDINGEFSLASDADISNSTTVGHVSITGTGDNTVHYYAVDVNVAGAIMTFDVDYGQDQGVSFDPWLRLFDSTGTVLQNGDDSSITQGAGGSTSSYDSFISYTAPSAGTYIIAIGSFTNLSPIVTGGTYELQVSIGVPVGSDPDSSGDTLYGQAGTDTLFGGAGNDTLIGGADADVLYGGAGLDTANYAGSGARVIANLFTGMGSGAGSDASGDTYFDIEGVRGSIYNDILVGRDGQSDYLFGGQGNDSLRANGGNDFVYGEGGNDLIFAGFGNDAINGGDGFDTLMLTNASAGSIVRLDLGTGSLNVAEGDTYTNIENVAGSAFRDLLYGDGNNNFLEGRGGDDLLVGNGGDDVLDGGTGFDTVSYANSAVSVSVSLFLGSGPGNDVIRNVEHLVGSSFNDLLVGNDGIDETLDGGAGADNLRGNGGNDTLNGGDGNDILFSGFGNDAHDGGEGFDTVTYGQASAGVIVRLDLGTGSLGHAAGDTYANIENITGSSAFRDLLYGNDIGNVIDGRGGNDLLIGNGGSDTLIGGNGFDKLDGGTGFDVLTGGAGDDTFVFEAGYQADRVTDFTIGEDQVDLTSFGYTLYSQVSSLMHTDGADTVLTFGSGDAIRLVGISLGDLSASDFIITAPPGNAPAEKASFAPANDSFDFAEEFNVQDPSMAFMQQELMAEWNVSQAMNVPIYKANEYGVLEIFTEDDFSYDSGEWLI